jgi:hypothetical protein
MGSARRWEIKKTVAGVKERRAKGYQRRCRAFCGQYDHVGNLQGTCHACTRGWKRRKAGESDRRISVRRTTDREQSE